MQYIKKSKEKNEKTNILFFTEVEIIREWKKNYKKKKKFQFDKQKNYIFIGIWDKIRKLFSIIKKNKTTVSSIFYFIYIEDSIDKIVKNLTLNSFIQIENISSINWFEIFIKTDWNWFIFLVYFFIKKKGFIIRRFKLFNFKFISPNFICWNRKNVIGSLFSILFLKKNVSLNPSYLLPLLIMRIKPGILRIAMAGKSQVIFFSIDIGFSNSCPIVVKRSSKKKKKKN
jgi:hypothetical protein